MFLRQLRTKFSHRRRRAFIFSLEKHLKDLADWKIPTAGIKKNQTLKSTLISWISGMFVWISFLRSGITDTQKFNEVCADQGVLLVPGQLFSPATNPPPSPYARLTFAAITDQQMDEAAKRLAASVLVFKRLSLQVDNQSKL